MLARKEQAARKIVQKGTQGEHEAIVSFIASSFPSSLKYHFPSFSHHRAVQVYAIWMGGRRSVSFPRLARQSSHNSESGVPAPGHLPPPPLFRSISGYWLLITWYISGLRSRYVGQAKKRALKMKGKRRNFGP